jgi:hypothetical protein
MIYLITVAVPICVTAINCSAVMGVVMGVVMGAGVDRKPVRAKDGFLFSLPVGD